MKPDTLKCSILTQELDYVKCTVQQTKVGGIFGNIYVIKLNHPWMVKEFLTINKLFIALK